MHTIHTRTTKPVFNGLLIVWLLLLLPASGIIAQGIQQDLLQKLKNASTKEKVAIYNQLAKTSLYEDPSRSIEYAEQALQLALKMGDKRGEADAYNNLGLGYYFMDDYERLLDFYKKSLSTYRSIGDNQSISGLSTLYFRGKQSEKAIENYKRSLNLYGQEETKDWKNIAATYRNLADVYKNIANYPQALDFYQQALELVMDVKPLNWQDEQKILLNKIGEIRFLIKDYKGALDIFQQLHHVFDSIGDQQQRSIILCNMANTYFYMDDFKESFTAYEEALGIQVQLNDYYGASMSLLNMGLIYTQQKQLTKALMSHRKSVALADTVNAKDLMRDNYLQLSEIYNQLGDYKRAYDYRILHSELSESIVMEKNVSELVDALTLQAFDEKSKENEILQAKNENYKLRLEKENLNKWRISFGFTILIVSILVFIVYYSYYLKREENRNLETRISEALKMQEEQQQIIMHQSSLTSLGELAAGIAHEINQPIQNISLSAESIKYGLEDPQPDKRFLNTSVNEIFEEIVRVREIVDHIRIFSSGQKESINEAFSVSDCVRSAVSIIGKQYANHQIDLQLNLKDPLPPVIGNPHKLEQVIHNLLSNARDAVLERHEKEESCRMTIKLTTFQNKQDICLHVEDNGVGIPEHRKTDVFLPFVTSKQLGKGTGLGLSISYSLVKEMNGRIELDSQVGEGTCFTLSIPISKEHLNL